MTDQTPSTEPTRESVRWAYSAEASRIFGGLIADHEARFDAWLAARDREVAAKTLREAVVSMRERKQPGHWNLTVKDEPGVSASPDSWLALLADRIDRGNV